MAFVPASVPAVYYQQYDESATRFRHHNLQQVRPGYFENPEFSRRRTAYTMEFPSDYQPAFLYANPPGIRGKFMISRQKRND